MSWGEFRQWQVARTPLGVVAPKQKGKTIARDMQTHPRTPRPAAQLAAPALEVGVRHAPAVQVLQRLGHVQRKEGPRPAPRHNVLPALQGRPAAGDGRALGFGWVCSTVEHPLSSGCCFCYC